MTITAYTGLPGSGKSYGVMQNVIIPALKSKRLVFTNIPVNDEKLLELLGSTVSKIDYEILKDKPDFFQSVIPAGAVVILDECWRLWPSGLKANNAIEGHKSFLAEHRHLVGDDGHSTEIVLATQDLAQIASFARVLVETTYRAEKLTRVGQSKKFRIDVYHGPVTGANPSKTNLDRQIFGSYKAEIYELYSSHTMSKTGLAGDETKTDNRSNILKGSFFIFAPIAFVVLGLFFYYGFFKVKEQYTPTDLKKVVESVTPIPGVMSDKITEKPKDFLAGKKILIDWNNSNRRFTHFIFRVIDGSQEFILEKTDLEKMGYVFDSVTQCLVFITIDKSKYVASCESPSTNMSSIFAASSYEKND